MAVIETASPGKDGLVRSCSIGYSIPKDTKDVTQYKGRRWVTITHSVQRLSLLLDIEEQDRPLTVKATIVKAGAVEAGMKAAEEEAAVKAATSVETADKTQIKRKFKEMLVLKRNN